MSSGGNNRGVKRPFREEEHNFTSAAAAPNPKRSRTNDAVTIFGALRNATATVWKFFTGSIGNAHMADKNKGHNKGSLSSRVLAAECSAAPPAQSSTSTQSDDVQFLAQVVFSKHAAPVDKKRSPAADDEEEVKLIKVVPRTFSIKTKRGTERDRNESKPGFILRKLQEKHPNTSNFAKKFHIPKSTVTSPTKYFLNSRTDLKMSGTPIRRRPRHRMVATDTYRRDEELAVYRKAFAASTPANMSSRAGFNAVESPLFSRMGVRSGIYTKLAAFQWSKVVKEETMLKDTTKQIPDESPDVVDLREEEEDTSSDDLVIVEENLRPRPKVPVNRPIAKSEDYDVIEILDEYAPRPTGSQSASKIVAGAHKSNNKKKNFNSLEAELSQHEVFNADYVARLKEKYDLSARERDRKIREETVKAEDAREKNKRLDKTLEERLKKHLSITDVAVEEVESEEEEEELPEITAEMEAVINKATNSRGETLTDKFNIPITKRDLDTLKGLNWLNDEIINFYMQMIVERSKGHDNWPKVYAFNTFFCDKLLKKGHVDVKRWTRKVDVFAYDLILVPVHIQGMHWCLGTMDLRKKAVHYYDSMGGDNKPVLAAFLKYLEDEHMDKKKQAFATKDFQAVILKNIPQQMNGSDCGMFTCKFAEYLSRNAEITFRQEDMPYFRRRMIYEIVSGKLLHP